MTLLELITKVYSIDTQAGYSLVTHVPTLGTYDPGDVFDTEVTLIDLFAWDESREGSTYWSKIHREVT